MQVHAFGTTEVPPFSFRGRDAAGVSLGARATVLGDPRLSRLTDRPPTTDHRGVKTCLQQQYMCAQRVCLIRLRIRARLLNKVGCLRWK